MFRMLKLKPPHGWNAVAWELGIVAVGVLVALGAQQLADNLNSRAQARKATAAMRAELADHYAFSVEWRVTTPCLIAQIDRLQDRLIRSGDRLDPAPVFNEPGIPAFVLRIPTKDYDSSAWHAAIADGVTAYLAPDQRTELSQHYQQAAGMAELTTRNGTSSEQVFSLSRAIPLDPAVRFSLMQSLDELRGRVHYMDLVSGQLIDHITRLDMVPEPGVAAHLLETSGTRLFCAQHGLPMRSLRDADKAIPYQYSPLDPGRAERK
jgi:hypothetical protein